MAISSAQRAVSNPGLPRSSVTRNCSVANKRDRRHARWLVRCAIIGVMFFGRSVETRDVTELLDDWQLVTITGPAGVGKTSLARAVGEELGGSRFIDLTTVTARASRQAISSRVDELRQLTERPGGHDVRLLVVLDNCEHVIDAAAGIAAELISNAFRVLATSREPLDLPAERVYRLEPFDTEGPRSAATEFLLKLAESRGIDRFDPAELDTLAKRLDGLPLALELASSRLNSMTPSEIADHLDARLDLLARSRANLPERHRSLSAAISWSYDLLDDNQRAFFRSLGAIESGFTVEMAAAAAGVSVEEARSAVQDLADRSLVSVSNIGRRSWYRLYETVKAFASEELGEEARKAALDRVATSVADLADSIARAYEQSHTVETPVTVDAMLPSGRAALDLTLERDAEPDRAYRILSPMWWMEDVGHQKEIAGMIRAALDHWEHIPHPRRSDLIATEAALLRVSGEQARAHALADEVIDEGTECFGLALAHRIRGMANRNAGDFSGSLAEFERAAAVARSIGHRTFQEELQMHIGLDEARAGNLDAAVDRLRRAVATTSYGTLNAVWLRITLGYLLIAGHTDEAVELINDTLNGEYGQPDAWSFATGHEQLGVALSLQGDYQAAARHLVEALRLSAAHGIAPELWLVLRAAAALFAATDSEDWERRALASAQSVFSVKTMGGFEEEFYTRVAGRDPSTAGPELAVGVDQIRVGLERIASGAASSTPGQRATVQGRLVRDGDVWHLDFDGESTTVKASKGLADIAALVGDPHREISALDLMGAVAVEEGTGELIDRAARNSYERRIIELQSDLDDAEAMNDTGRAEAVRSELDAIVAHLANATGMGGRARVEAGSAEKARSAVTWRIRSAIRRLAKDHPAAGDHLDRYIATGRFCVYDPPGDPKWEVIS